VLTMPALFETIGPAVMPTALVTDLGSVKGTICGWAGSLPYPERFVGGHPMAGSEQSGVEAAMSGLFEGATWCLTPTKQTDPDALQAITDLVTRLGAVPYLVDPRTHDRLVAGISHLPMLAAAALVRSLTDSPDWDMTMDLAAGGFRDTTRVASGDPIMARDISLANAGQILPRLDAYIRALRRLRSQIASGNAAIEQEFRAAREAREAWLRHRGQP
jgi:prephenate dehydrogenase